MGESEIHALRGVDLELLPGEFVVLLGASGSDKSTLLNILGGLDRPTSGEVRYRDHVLATAAPAELTRFRREHVGFVFQFYNLIPSLTAYENVALVTEIAGAPMDADDALATQACRRWILSALPPHPRESSRLVAIDAHAAISRPLSYAAIT
jgi:putative ABC transport system ATP-binding protein